MKPYCVTVVLPGDFYIKTAEQLIHKAAQPADVVSPLVLSISMAKTYCETSVKTWKKTEDLGAAWRIAKIYEGQRKK